MARRVHFHLIPGNSYIEAALDSAPTPPGSSLDSAAGSAVISPSDMSAAACVEAPVAPHTDPRARTAFLRPAVPVFTSWAPVKARCGLPLASPRILPLQIRPLKKLHVSVLVQPAYVQLWWVGVKVPRPLNRPCSHRAFLGLRLLPSWFWGRTGSRSSWGRLGFSSSSRPDLLYYNLCS